MTNLKLMFLLNYFRRYHFLLIVGGFSVFILSILILPSPLITRRIIDITLPGKKYNELIFLILIVLGLLLLMKTIGYFQNLLFYKINTKVILDIRLDLLKKINRLPLKTSKKYGAGYLISRINDDTNRLRSLFADTLIGIAKDLLTFLVGLTAIFIIHWRLALLSTIILPVFFLSSIYFSRIIRRLSMTYYEDNARNTMKLEESINMQELSKTFLFYKYCLVRYYKSAKRAFLSDVKLGKYSFLNSTLSGFICGIAPILILGYGGYEIIQGRLTIGSIIAFNSFVGYLFGPAGRLVNVNVRIQKALMALTRVKGIFDLPEEKISKKFQLKGDISSLTLDNVSFSYHISSNELLSLEKTGQSNWVKKSLETYPNKDFFRSNPEIKKVLNQVSFTIRAGEKIGIVGSSGCGKTTLLRVLTGLYEIAEGKIILNNKILSPSELVSLRKYISVVEQEPLLFNDTVYNNIRFANPRAEKAEIVNAAKSAYAHQFITKLRNGYFTMLDQKGNNLSVGQKQRIALARALVRKPKILILDEVTANLDIISEKSIVETIDNLPRDMIVILISHRPSLIQKADRIFVIVAGRLVDQGTHTELINNNSFYTSIFKNQLLNF